MAITPAGTGTAIQRVVDLCGRERLALDRFSPDKSGTKGRRTKCKACRTQQAMEWYAKNRDVQYEKHRTYVTENLEVVRATDMKRYERNREKRIALASLHAEKRRLLLKDQGHNPDVSRESLRAQYGDDCYYCGITMEFWRTRRGNHYPNQGTMEHLVPVAKGGWHDWDNVVLACWSCNSNKGNRTVQEWEADRARLSNSTLGLLSRQ